MASSFTLPTGTPSFGISIQSRVAVRGVRFCCAQKPKSESHGVKRCLRCNNLYTDEDNSSTACSFHGHVTGEKGLFSLAPPHQGIDGEWTDRSGVIVYKWNERSNRPNTGSANWKKRWSCCSEYAWSIGPTRFYCKSECRDIAKQHNDGRKKRYCPRNSNLVASKL